MKTKLNKTRTKAPKTKKPSSKISQVKTKDQARQVAMDFQEWASNQNLSYGELAQYQSDLHKLAKRFGLVKEFKENAII